ncbi:MAG: hypothetical protein U9R34_00645 [Nanoarchaeota archaeon]|nr:hypothetical protein [Nanoarchaeota archaeon]
MILELQLRKINLQANLEKFIAFKSEDIEDEFKIIDNKLYYKDPDLYAEFAGFHDYLCNIRGSKPLFFKRDYINGQIDIEKIIDAISDNQVNDYLYQYMDYFCINDSKQNKIMTEEARVKNCFNYGIGQQNGALYESRIKNDERS